MVPGYVETVKSKSSGCYAKCHTNAIYIDFSPFVPKSENPAKVKNYIIESIRDKLTGFQYII